MSGPLMCLVTKKYVQIEPNRGANSGVLTIVTRHRNTLRVDSSNGVVRYRLGTTQFPLEVLDENSGRRWIVNADCTKQVEKKIP
ncbi:hypothetical protein [Vibrio cionasavignyae]|uniref:hypothetical protein n=1 Tax=Vibrio cionasavignyae TaxID=2910252 RepID=UPI003D0A977C